MPKTTTAGELAREYCRKWPNLPDLTLAKKMFKDNPLVFNSLEHARSIVRTTRGHHGKQARKEIKDKSLFKPLTFKTDVFSLPESKTVKANVFNLPTAIKKVLLIGDLHFPYQDNQAIEAAIQDGIDEGVDCIYLNGDVLDCFQLSFHEKDPRKTSIPEELEMGRQFFAYLREKFPTATIYYIPGNHEYRLERYLRVKAPELLDVPEFQMDVLLRVREYNIIYLPHGSKVYFGKLLVEHGDKLRGAGGVNPARTLSLKLKRHTLCNHFHRTTEDISKVYDGDSVICYSVGCLAELEPQYLPINNHNHGHAIIDMLGGGEFSVKNKKIVNGKVY